MRRNLATWAGCASCLVLVFAAGCGDDGGDDQASGGSSAATGGATNHGGNNGLSGGVAGHSATSGGQASGGTDSTESGGTPAAGGTASAKGGQTSAGGNSEAGESSGGTTVVGPEGGAGGGNIVEGGAGGNTGSGGTTAVSNTVHGTLIDFYGHKIPNIPIMIGDTTVVTNAQGKFDIEDVAAMYDVTVLLSFPQGGGQGIYTWIYQGLTRRDPTLQVYQGLETQSGSYDITLTNGSFGSDDRTQVAFGSVDGSSTSSNFSGPEMQSSFSWDGPTQTAGRVHALYWTQDNDLPTAFKSYMEQPVSLSAVGTDATAIPITFPTTNSVSTAALSGTVTSSMNNDRRNYVSAHFSSDARIQLVDDWSATDTFSYLVPDISGTKISIAASAGTDWRPIGPFALAHKDVDAGTANIQLTLPTPPTPLAPASETTNVTSATQFQWNGAAKVFLFHVGSDYYYEGVYILTSKKQINIPDINGSFPLPGNNAVYYWNVEVHGALASVDAATGASGFIDAYGPSHDRPEGSARSDGTFAISASRSFYTPE